MRLSIIIPVYNVARYLRVCLDSVLAQTAADWECICVDDGSTDGSGAILDEYVENGRFRVLHQANAGVAAARNAAFAIATGDYVVFLDADDLWSPDLLSVVLPLLESEDPDILRFAYTKFVDGGPLPQIAGHPVREAVFSGEEVADWALRTLTKGGYCCTSFIRRKLIGEARFPVGVKYAEDSLFLLRVAQAARRIVQIDYAGYLYRDTPCSAMKRAFGSEERFRFFTEFEKVCLLYARPHACLSWMAWFNLMNWIRKPADVIRARELWTTFSGLVNEGLVRVSDLCSYARIPCWLYVKFGWRFPAVVVYASVSLAVKVRDSVFRK